MQLLLFIIIQDDPLLRSSLCRMVAPRRPRVVGIRRNGNGGHFHTSWMVYLDCTGQIIALVVPGRSTSTVAHRRSRSRSNKERGILPLLADETDISFCFYMVQNSRRGPFCKEREGVYAGIGHASHFCFFAKWQPAQRTFARSTSACTRRRCTGTSRHRQCIVKPSGNQCPSGDATFQFYGMWIEYAFVVWFQIHIYAQFASIHISVSYVEFYVYCHSIIPSVRSSSTDLDDGMCTLGNMYETYFASDEMNYIHRIFSKQ